MRASETHGAPCDTQDIRLTSFVKLAQHGKVDSNNEHKCLKLFARSDFVRNLFFELFFCSYADVDELLLTSLSYFSAHMLTSILLHPNANFSQPTRRSTARNRGAEVGSAASRGDAALSIDRIQEED